MDEIIVEYGYALNYLLDKFTHTRFESSFLFVHHIIIIYFNNFRDIFMCKFLIVNSFD